MAGGARTRAAAIGCGRRPAVVSTAADGSRALIIARLSAWMAQEAGSGRGPVWLPVAFGAGVLAYFQAEQEPSITATVGFALGLAAASWACRARPVGFGVIVLAAFAAAGFAVATLCTATLIHPVLTRPVVATVSGFVAVRDQRQRSDRIVLHVTAWSPTSTAPPPTRVRLVLRPGQAPPVGSHAMMRARLDPPAGPARPGAYDFERDLWFAGIGATGLALGTPRLVPPPTPMPWTIAGWRAVEAVRDAIGRRIRHVLPGDAGAIATALVTGERDAIAETTNEVLRISGLYHVISISGLHMVVVVGTVVFALRGILALVPGLATRRPIKKWAAAAALVCAAGYLVLSGGEVATARAFVMTGLVLVGVLIDRAALTLRTLGGAALVVMVAMPESVLNPGFQMSFAATLALVAFYEHWAPRRDFAEGAFIGRIGPVVLVGIAGLVLTSLVAATATAPFVAHHFHRLSPYGVVANLVAMPIVSAVVMPAGLAALLLLPFGIDRPAWQIMGWGIERTLDVSTWVAALSGADARIAAFGAGPLLLAVAALLAGALLVSPLRLAALPALGVALLSAATPPRPDVLVDGTGRLVAVRVADGRLAILGSEIDRFVARSWLAADGDRRGVDRAALQAPFSCDPEGCVARLRDGTVVAVARTLVALEEDCATAALVVTRHAVPMACAAMRIDPRRLATTGALALTRTIDGWQVQQARDALVSRPWIARAPPSSVGARTGEPAPDPQ